MTYCCPVTIITPHGPKLEFLQLRLNLRLPSPIPLRHSLSRHTNILTVRTECVSLFSQVHKTPAWGFIWINGVIIIDVTLQEWSGCNSKQQLIIYLCPITLSVLYISGLSQCSRLSLYSIPPPPPLPPPSLLHPLFSLTVFSPCSFAFWPLLSVADWDRICCQRWEDKTDLYHKRKTEHILNNNIQTPWWGFTYTARRRTPKHKAVTELCHNSYFSQSPFSTTAFFAFSPTVSLLFLAWAH